jgi:hypothetical protein
MRHPSPQDPSRRHSDVSGRSPAGACRFRCRGDVSGNRRWVFDQRAFELADKVFCGEYGPLVRWVVIALVGAIAGVLCDQIHVIGGVIVYRDPLLFGQPWWVPVQYGLAAVVGYVGAWHANGASERILVASAWFLGAYLATAVFQRWPLPLALALGVIGLARTIRLGGRSLVFGLAVALSGLVWEAGLTSTGAFSYRHPNLVGVAFWLPALYVNAAPLLLAVAARYRQDRLDLDE